MDRALFNPGHKGTQRGKRPQNIIANRRNQEQIRSSRGRYGSVGVKCYRATKVQRLFIECNQFNVEGRIVGIFPARFSQKRTGLVEDIHWPADGNGSERLKRENSDVRGSPFSSSHSVK